MSFRTVADIKRANAMSGYHFFDPDTMSFFDSKIHDKVYGGCFFITSEQFHGSRASGARKYSVRICHPKGDIDTVGEHMAFDSLQDAELAVQDILLMHKKYLSSGESPGYGKRLYLSETISPRLKERMDLLSVCGSNTNTYKMVVSQCRVYMWEFASGEKCEEALSYLIGYGYTKADAERVGLTSVL